MAKLILRVEGGEETFSLDDKGSLTIGRSPDCDITITDSQASRRHCSVVKLQSGFEVADLGSTNGTLVNSTLVKRQKLRHGDVIRIGAVEIVYNDPSSAARPGEASLGLLVYAKGDRKGERVELKEQRTTIGRKSTNTLVLEDLVCSSYHCEIVRDLNGYTIRDLGSTNGTLVNGEMITEAQLTHGARVRIGNTRFVFQDPAMAEIDLELAAVEEDDEWGMMRDLDLAAVRKRNPATIFYTLLFVALLGAGAYFGVFAQPQAEGQGGPQGPGNNRIDDWSMESAASRFAWGTDTAGDVTARLGSGPVASGKSALELESRVDAADAFYTTTLSGDGVRYHLTAKMAARDGATARLGLLWSGRAMERWELGPPVTSSSLTSVDLRRSAPPWANRVRLGVRIRGKGTVVLDDVALVPEGPADQAVVDQNEFRLTISDGTDADLTHAGATILAHGRLVARDGSGRAVDASGVRLEAEAEDAEHMRLTLRGGEGAALLGLEFEDVTGFLSRGGFRAFTPDDEKTFHSGFPDKGELELQGVRKLLLGPSGRAFAVVGGTDAARLRTEASVGDERRTWTVLGPPEDGAFSFRFKTNLRGEATAASERMAEALGLHGAGRYGEFLEKAQAALAEFPFASKTAKDQLSDLVRQVNEQIAERLRRLDQEVTDYKAFKDLQDLADASAVIGELRERYQIEPGSGGRAEIVDEVDKEVQQLLLEARKARQSAHAEPLLLQALFIHIPKGEIHSALLLLSYVSWFLPEADQAAQARTELAKIRKNHPQAVGALQRLGLEEK